MPCSRKEALARLFSYVTTSVKFLFLFFYLFSLFVAKLFSSLFRSEDEYDDDMVYEEDEEEHEEVEEEEEEDESVKKKEEWRYSHVESDHLVADIVNGGEGLVFMTKNCHKDEQNLSHAHTKSYDSVFEDPVEAFDAETIFHFQDSAKLAFDDHDDNIDDGEIHFEAIKEKYVTVFSNSEEIFASTDEDRLGHSSDTNTKHHGSRQREERKVQDVKEESIFTEDEKFLIFSPPKSEAKKLEVLEKEDEDAFGDSCTVGSTSKSSSEWRSSIRDSATEDPFSSSSRRSCPKWESYTVYQKYDEEMMCLDRISARKLHETESLKSFQVEPRSISQRIVHKLANNKKQRSSERIYQNTYQELEAAYVAQICLTWEALNWNYANFLRKRASITEQNRGCPAHVAQQFQQFQVLLQRYIENEPYERGRRPEIYARMRSIAPKLLLVPEYQDYEDDQKEEGVSSRISSESFLTIIEDGIKTFMKFLKADRESHCQVIAALFRGRPRGSIDPALIQMLKKNNKKKKLKVKDLQRPRNFFKKRKVQREEEMEILMSLIDLKVVSRVLRMACITEEQLNWCEGKMGKTRISQGKLHRDSSPLFLPTTLQI